MKEINESREVQQNNKLDDNEPDKDFPQVMGEAKSAMKDIHDLQNNGSKIIDLEKRIAMLNLDQLRIFTNIKNHLVHQYQHETDQCTCNNFKPLHMFFSGVGGTGKSFLIETIRTQVTAIWGNDGDELTCAVAAPTGLAAFNVGGVTIHRLLQLPIEHENNTAYWSLPKESRKVLYATLKSMKLLIIDEISMVSNLNLAYLHLRLEEIFGGSDWFGSMNVIFVGDLLQLPPVKGAPIFESVNNKAIQSKLGCITSVNIWKDTIVYDELTINERQKKDKSYSMLLNQVRCGHPPQDVIDALKERVMSCSVVEKFQQLKNDNQSPVCLFPTRKACEELNNKMLNMLGNQVIKIDAVDEVDDTASNQSWNNKATKELSRLNNDCNLTAGLEAILHIAEGARIMLRRNICTKTGLVNGSLGTVKNVSRSFIMVKFDHLSKPVQIEKVKSRFQV